MDLHLFSMLKKKKLTLKVCCWFKLFSLCCRWREAVSIFHKPSWHRRSTQTLLASDITQNSAAWYIKYKKRKASNKKMLCRFYLLQEELFCCQVVLQLSQRWVTCDSVSHKMSWEQYTWTLEPTGGLRGMLPCMKMLLIWKLNEFIWGTLKTNIRAYIINNMNKGDLECKNVFYIFDSSCLVITSINIIELSRCSIVDGPHGPGRTLKDQNLYSQTFWESSPNLA